MDDQRKDHIDPRRPLKGTNLSYDRPIICQLIMKKILTAQIREDIYDSLIRRGLFTEEKKGCCKRTRGTSDLLYIYRHILNES